jgi:hypothetical protein
MFLMSTPHGYSSYVHKKRGGIGAGQNEGRAREGVRERGHKHYKGRSP